MTEGMKPASPWRVAAAIIAAVTAFGLACGLALQADREARLYHAAYERVCDAAGTEEGRSCVERVRRQAEFQAGAAVLGSQDAATLQAQLDTARAEGRAEALAEQLSTPQPPEARHAPPPDRPQPAPRRQRLDRRLCDGTPFC